MNIPQNMFKFNLTLVHNLRKAPAQPKRICWVSPGFRAEHPRAAHVVDCAVSPWTPISDKRTFLDSWT